MVRTQIQLTEAQARGLKKLSAERRVSMAELIRQAVERILKEDERREKWRRVLEMPTFSSVETDVAEEHDKYLGEERW